MNFIEAIDAVIYDNNGDIDVDWYEIVNIFLIWTQNEFLYEGISTADAVYGEEYDQTVETVFLDDKTIQISNISMNNVDNIRIFFMILEHKWM